MKKIFFLITIILAIILPDTDLQSKTRLVTIGGSVTEIVFELGMGNLVVAVDQSSTLPYKVKDLPQVGYIRAISSEGVLSMEPTKILTTTDIGPPNSVKQIKNSGVEMIIYKSPKSIEDIIDLITKISTSLEVNIKGNAVKKNIKQIMNEINGITNSYKNSPKVAFFMNPATGSYTAAGSGTNANYLIELMGGNNIFSKEFNRYQKVNKEEILKYNPDIILVASHYPGQKASSHFIENSEFESLIAIKKGNIIDISMTDLTMGPSFPLNVLSIINRVNIENK